MKPIHKSIGRSFAEYISKENDISFENKDIFIKAYNKYCVCKKSIIEIKHDDFRIDCIPCFLRSYSAIVFNDLYKNQLVSAMLGWFSEEREEYAKYKIKFELDFSVHVKGIFLKVKNNYVNKTIDYRGNYDDSDCYMNDCFDSFKDRKIKCIFGRHALDETRTYCKYCNFIYY